MRNCKASVLGGLGASAPAAPDTVDADEANCSKCRQDAARDRGPETPAEIREVQTRYRLGAVVAAGETAERRHCCRLEYDCKNTCS